MSELEVQVREDGTVVIPATDIAELGVKPGETLAVSLERRPSHRKSSRGLLKGVLPTLSFDDFRADRAERLKAFEGHRGL